MGGDGRDLAELDALASRGEAVLLIDEAHATGVLGPGGRGRAAFLEGRENVVTVHTCGKALGTAGGVVGGSRGLKGVFVYSGGAVLFLTGPPPFGGAGAPPALEPFERRRSSPGGRPPAVVAAVTRAAIDLCERSDSRREELRRRVDCATRALSRYCGLTGSGSHVVPIVVGEDGAAVELAAGLRACGFDLRAIRPPTVPVGTARLLVSFPLHVTDAR